MLIWMSQCGCCTRVTWQNYLFKKREFYPTSGRCYLRGPWKLCELSVWSQEKTVYSSSSRVGQRTSRGRARARMNRKKLYIKCELECLRVAWWIKGSAHIGEVMCSVSEAATMPNFKIINYLRNNINIFRSARGIVFTIFNCRAAQHQVKWQHLGLIFS